MWYKWRVLHVIASIKVIIIVIRSLGRNRYCVNITIYIQRTMHSTSCLKYHSERPKIQHIQTIRISSTISSMLSVVVFMFMIYKLFSRTNYAKHLIFIWSTFLKKMKRKSELLFLLFYYSISAIPAINCVCFYSVHFSDYISCFEFFDVKFCMINFRRS